jgi:hypothetical protein
MSSYKTCFNINSNPSELNMKNVTSIGTLELLVKEKLLLRPFKLSAAVPRSTLT